MPAEPVISVEGLARRYGRRYGVRGLDLEVSEGAIYGFLGPNGAGKTTAIRVLLGFLRPHEGSATIFGQDCWRRSARIKRDVGYVPGDLRLYPWMTLRSGLAMAGRARGRDLRSAGAAYAERFRLDPTIPVRAMSRGTRQKLGLLLALAPRPRLLLLDEPTSGLDPLMQDVLADCLRELSRAGHTVFFSSHTLSEVERICDRVGIVRDGRMIADERIEALRRRARRVVTLVFRDAAAADEAPPACLADVRRDGARWDATLEGGAREFLRWAEGQPIDDVTITPPDLERVFRRFYAGDEGAS
ncbi:MAG: ABC transporter ATP-binding protein [Planctomycetota bacterium]|jgi:ABC-2 type transport system ATP-binding protein